MKRPQYRPHLPQHLLRDLLLPACCTSVQIPLDAPGLLPLLMQTLYPRWRIRIPIKTMEFPHTSPPSVIYTFPSPLSPLPFPSPQSFPSLQCPSPFLPPPPHSPPNQKTHKKATTQALKRLYVPPGHTGVPSAVSPQRLRSREVLGERGKGEKGGGKGGEC